MKHPFLMVVLTFCIFSQYTFAQDATTGIPEKYTAHNKGKFYIYWGGNRESFSKSDIRFHGDGYDFTLYDVTAQDRPKGWHIDYFNPLRMTIPQTNLRIGYFINDHYNISIGVDHMKYVMNQNIVVNYKGNYLNRGLYGENIEADGSNLNNNLVRLTDNFLTFEHTDGLNYINTEISRVDDVTKYISKTINTDKFQINITVGAGLGVLLPRTNTKLFNKERYDEFHLSGYGASAKVGLNFTFFKHFFIQAELKEGYINMPNIRTSYDPNDRAKQDFWFFQRILAIGGVFKI